MRIVLLNAGSNKRWGIPPLDSSLISSFICTHNFKWLFVGVCWRVCVCLFVFVCFCLAWKEVSGWDLVLTFCPASGFQCLASGVWFLASVVSLPCVNIREDACSRTGGIFIRDTACHTACSLRFSELWRNQGQTMRNHTPYHTAYTTVWRMILGRMHALKFKKISCKSLQKSIEAMVMKEKHSHKSHSVYLMKTVNKRGERSSQSYYKSNVSPYGSCYHSFCMRTCEAVAYEIEDAYCRTGEDTAYDTWLCGMSEWFVPRHAVWITHLYGIMPVVQSWIK